MISTEEGVEGSTKIVRNMVGDIMESLKDKIALLKNRVDKAREQHFLHERQEAKEVTKLTRMLEAAKETNRTLRERQELIHQAIAGDELELNKLDTQNQNIQAQLKELQMYYKNLTDKKAEETDKISTLNARYQILKNKHDAKAREQLPINQNYKTYLGIDISRIRDSHLKITFYNLGAECYVIIDFDRQDCVTMCVPELNLERLNFIFREGVDFYKFIRLVREEMQQKL